MVSDSLFSGVKKRLESFWSSLPLTDFPTIPFVLLSLALWSILSVLLAQGFYAPDYRRAFFILWLNGSIFLVAWRRMDLAFLLWLFFVPLLNVSFSLGWEEKTFSFDKLAFVFCILAYAIYCYRRGGWNAPPRAVAAAWFFLLAFFSLTTFTAGNRWIHLWHLVEQLISFFVFWIAYDLLSDPATRTRVIWTFVAVGVLLTSLALFQGMFYVASGKPIYLGWFPDPRWGQSFGGPIGHKNYYAAFQVLFVPFLIALLSGTGRRIRLMLLVPFLLLGVFASFYRGWSYRGWSLGGGFALLSALAVYIVFQKKQRIALLLLTAAFGLALAVLFWRDLENGAYTRKRLHYVRVGAVAWKEAPLLGHGLGSFPRKFHETEPRVVSPSNPDFHGKPASAHNVYLRILVEGGLAGVVAYLSLLVVLLLRLYRSVVRAEEGRDRNLAIAALASFVGICLQSGTEEVLMHSGFVFLLWTLVCLALNFGRTSSHSVPAG